MRIERHPTGVLVREDGCVYLPESGSNKAHWTYGYSYGRGYMRVQVNGKRYKVHRLVAEAFIPNPENKKEIDHINRNPQDNRVENLRWCTRYDNNRNTSKNDRVDARGGTHSYEDKKKYWIENSANYRKTHKEVTFSDGKRRWLPNSEALELLKLTVKERVYGK